MPNAIAVAIACLLVAPAAAWGQSEPFSLTAEALVWWMKDSPAPPPLVSTGVLGQPGTRTLLGGEAIDTPVQPGLRMTAGYWLTERWGLEASAFYLPTVSTSQSVGASGLPGSQGLVIPFFDVTLHGENVTGLASPGLFSGQATQELSSRLIGAEMNGLMNLASTPAWRIDLLGGFRYLNLREVFTFTTSSPGVPPGPVDIFQTKDQFETTNNFYGGQVGVRGRYGWRSWVVSGAVKFAMGAMAQSVGIDGFLLANSFNGLGTPQKFLGGYFAQPTNIGNYNRSVFAVVPEIGLNVGYEVTSWMTVFLGYTFLYTNNVARPGNQIDRSINPSQNPSFAGPPPTPLVGPARPAFSFQGSDFWAQGLNVGVAFRF
jgi:hypothetical protein